MKVLLNTKTINKKMLLNTVVLCLITQVIMAQLPSNIPSNGLIGYWAFNGNTNDLSGNNFNATNFGATSTNDRFGNPNSAYSFNGTSNYMSCGPISALNGLSNASISVWVKIIANNSWTNCNLGCAQYLISRDADFSSSNIGIAWGPNSQKFAGRFGPNSLFSTQEVRTVSLYPLPQEQWIHIVFVKTNSALRIYINGVLDNSNNVVNPNFGTSNGALFFGKLPVNGFDYFLNGLLDDIGIWNRALTQEEITNLYNANQCITNITVTDTLIINVGQLSFNDPVTWANNITIAPNPASTEININFNNITNLVGGSINIINSLGQSVATTPITATGTQTTMQLSVWGGTGMYFVQIINAQGQIVDIKKIILQ
jgi:hypothetical protein